MDAPRAIEYLPEHEQALVADAARNDSVHKQIAPRPDGLVRETKTKKVVSREEIQERTETEDIKHLGDFSDEVSALSRLLQHRGRGFVHSR